jgi:lipopolysaccharide transport system permease protein
MNKAAMGKSDSWDLIISPQQSFFQLDLKGIWRYRDLLWLFVRRDFVSFYKQTILGPLWFFIQPLFTSLIYTFVFSGVANIPTDHLPAPLFYVAGVTAWNYFSDCITKTSTIFKDNVNILGKVYFPRAIMPLSVVISNLIRFAVQMILFLLMMIWFGWIKANPDQPIHFTSYILLFPFIVLLMAFLGLGLGMIVSAMTTRYRDLQFLVVFGVQLLMYGTVVIYPLSSVEARFRHHSWLVKYNPMTPLIETFRLGFLGQGTFSWGLLGYAAGITVFILLFGFLIFNKVERSFVDTI